jgi:hypothetical protein
MTAAEILSLLKIAHRPPEWVGIPELRCGTGWGKRSEQRIDYWTINCYPSHGLKRIAYEIKVDRRDYLHEIEDPLKRRGALLISNQFYFATPPSLLDPKEIPIECGLIELAMGKEKPPGGGWRSVHFARLQGWMREVVDAPVRETVLPTWRFVASLLRRAANLEKADDSDSRKPRPPQAEVDPTRRVPQVQSLGGIQVEELAIDEAVSGTDRL